MTRFHMDAPNENDAVLRIQSVKTDTGRLVISSKDGRKNVARCGGIDRHLWRAETSHGTRWAEWKHGIGWTVTREEPR